MSIRIMLVDDHMVMRQGLSGLLRWESDFEIAGEASDGESAIRLAHEIRPDVVLMDIGMPGMDGIQATTRIVDIQDFSFRDTQELTSTSHIHVGDTVQWNWMGGPHTTTTSPFSTFVVHLVSTWKLPYHFETSFTWIIAMVLQTP